MFFKSLKARAVVARSGLAVGLNASEKPTFTAHALLIFRFTALDMIRWVGGGVTVD